MFTAKKKLAVTFAGSALLVALGWIAAPAATAASGNYGIDDCTFCGSRTERCNYNSRMYGLRTCYYPLNSGSTSCPPCTPCQFDPDAIVR